MQPQRLPPRHGSGQRVLSELIHVSTHEHRADGCSHAASDRPTKKPRQRGRISRAPRPTSIPPKAIGIPFQHLLPWRAIQNRGCAGHSHLRDHEARQDQAARPSVLAQAAAVTTDSYMPIRKTDSLGSCTKRIPSICVAQRIVQHIAVAVVALQVGPLPERSGQGQERPNRGRIRGRSFCSLTHVGARFVAGNSR